MWNDSFGTTAEAPNLSNGQTILSLLKIDTRLNIFDVLLLMLHHNASDFAKEDLFLHIHRGVRAAKKTQP
jgi:hypothetical protein